MENTGNNTSFFGGPGGQKARKKERVGQLKYCEKERNDRPRTSSIVSRRTTDADGQQLTTPKHVSSNDVIATSPWSDTIGAKNSHYLFSPSYLEFFKVLWTDSLLIKAVAHFILVCLLDELTERPREEMTS